MAYLQLVGKYINPWLKSSAKGLLKNVLIITTLPLGKDFGSVALLVIIYSLKNKQFIQASHHIAVQTVVILKAMAFSFTLW